ncbi:hypothetical protein Y956_00071, partial [Nipponia nippon]
AGHTDCPLARERARSFSPVGVTGRSSKQNWLITKFCQQEHFLKRSLMLRISSTSSTILLRKRNILYCDLPWSYFVSNYRKIK